MRDAFTLIWPWLVSVGLSFDVWQDRQLLVMNANPKFAYVSVESVGQDTVAMPVDCAPDVQATSASKSASANLDMPCWSPQRAIRFAHAACKDQATRVAQCFRSPRRGDADPKRSYAGLAGRTTRAR